MEEAIIPFKSVATVANAAPYNAPRAPNHTINNKAVELNSNNGLILISNTTPAVTIVDEC